MPVSIAMFICMKLFGGQRLPAGYALDAWRTVSSKAMSGKQDRHGCKKVTLVTAKQDLIQGATQDSTHVT